MPNKPPTPQIPSGSPAPVLIPGLDITECDLQSLHRQQFWNAGNAAFSALRERADDWEEEQAERQLWSQTLLDGLEECSLTAQSDSKSSDR